MDVSWEGQEGKILESSWQLLVPEDKFLAPVAVVEQGQTSSQPTKGIPGSAREGRGAVEDPALGWDGTPPKACPVPSLLPAAGTAHRALALAEGWSSGCPSSPGSAPLPLNSQKFPFLQGCREARGAVGIPGYACDVFPCCWKVSKGITGADETFQHIHLESAVSLPSCIIYHTIPSCLKDCFKLFSESSFPPFAASCNNLSQIYFGSGILQQSLVLFAFFFFPNCSVADAESWFVIEELQGQGLQIPCPEALPRSTVLSGVGMRSSE